MANARVVMMIPGAYMANVTVHGARYKVMLKEWICPKGEVYLVASDAQSVFDSETLKNINLALLEFQEYNDA